jgi:hypothetical protein
MAVAMKSHFNLAEKIEAAYLNAPRKEAVRAYLGASIVGNQCLAYLAFSLRGFPETPVDGRLQRIFNLGHVIEDVVLNDLKKAGLDIIDRDSNGRQIEWVMYGGHVKMHGDGQIAEDGKIVAILEIKSMGDSKYKEFVAKGIRNSHRNYYEQVMLMMAGSGIPTAVLIAYNKNNSDYHSEVVEFDEIYSASQRLRIEQVLSNLATKISSDPSDWRCRECFKRTACWEQSQPEKACRNCQFALAVPDGEWWCEKHNHGAYMLCNDHEYYAPMEKL